MKRGENFLFRVILYYKIQLVNFLKNLSHIAPVSPIFQSLAADYGLRNNTHVTYIIKIKIHSLTFDSLFSHRQYK